MLLKEFQKRVQATDGSIMRSKGKLRVNSHQYRISNPS